LARSHAVDDRHDNAERSDLMKRRPWIVLGSLTGLVACPTLVALAAVLVRDLRGPVFEDQGLPVLMVSGAAGILIGGVVASRVAMESPQRMALLGAVCGSTLGAAAIGSLFLAVVVAGDDWPDGLSVFLTGATIGALMGGLLGGVVGFVQGDASGARHASAATSLRDVR